MGTSQSNPRKEPSKRRESVAKPNDGHHTFLPAFLQRKIQSNQHTSSDPVRIQEKAPSRFTFGETPPQSPPNPMHMQSTHGRVEKNSSKHHSKKNEHVISSNAVEHQEVPTLIVWNQGGTNVSITGTFTDWKKSIPLISNQDEFSVLLRLSPGIHQYRFLVDGQWRTAPNQPLAADDNGNLNNCIEVKGYIPKLSQTPQRLVANKFSPPGVYAHLLSLSFTVEQPPMLPPHLLRALLNAAPNDEDPSVLPLPHHVMLNHVYSVGGEDGTGYGVVACTHRVENKFFTTILYSATEDMSTNASSYLSHLYAVCPDDNVGNK